MIKNPLKFIIHTERPGVRNDKDSELDVAIEITAKSTQSPKKPEGSQNVCIVLDCSSSMGGSKLEISKKSAIEIYNRLGSDDLFTIVSFNNKARVVVNPTSAPQDIVKKIGEIRASGNTDISLGWRLGLLEVQSYSRPQDINKIILLSDGQANKGETKATVFEREAIEASKLGITVSTIGVGNDFQEDILVALSEGSGGRFWYIQESRIEDILNGELNESLSVLIDRPRVGLILPKGVKFSKDLNNLKKIGTKYMLRPIPDNFKFTFAIRLKFFPNEIESDLINIRAILFNGKKYYSETERNLRLEPFQDYTLSEDNFEVFKAVKE